MASSNHVSTVGSVLRRPGKRRSSKRKPRQGVAAVEFAVLAPLLFLLIFGMIEFGRMVMVQQILTNASREGARRGILEQATATEVNSVVVDYLTNSSVAGATVTISPASLSDVGFGDPVKVSVSVPFDQVSWIPAPWFLARTNLTAQSVMRAERPE